MFYVTRGDKLWIAMEFCGGGSLQDIYHGIICLFSSNCFMLFIFHYRYGQFK